MSTARHVKAFVAETLGEIEVEIEKFLFDCNPYTENVIVDLKYTFDDEGLCTAMIIYEIRNKEDSWVSR